MKAFVIMGRTLKSTYEDLFLVVTLSVLWWAGTLLIVTAPMTSVGLHHVANRVANYKRVNISFFWEGARAHIGKGVLLFLLLLLAPPIMVFSVVFYLENGGWLLVLAVVLAPGRLPGVTRSAHDSAPAQSCRGGAAAPARPARC